MVLYERGNAAKQWIFLELERMVQERPLRILDLACGDGRLWKEFLDRWPNVSVVGVDTDEKVIARGNDKYSHDRLDLRVFDAQKPISQGSFDVVVAFSAIEHVVDRAAFLRTVWEALLSNGQAYLNYDVGHFRSHDVKERLMVPVSQLLAIFGVEGPYMKRVDDRLFSQQALSQGFRVVGFRKHNLYPLKGFFRDGSHEAVVAWVEFEERLNQLYSAPQLDLVMWSTTLILQKP